MNQDRLAEEMLPVAAALAVAVDEEDAATIEQLVTTLSRNQLNALVVVLAAHIDPDKPFIRAVIAGATKRAARATAHAFGIPLGDMLGKSRSRDLLDARAVTYYAAHLCGDSYAQIGRVMNRDHTTVMPAVARVGETPRLRELGQQIARHLGWERPIDEQTVA